MAQFSIYYLSVVQFIAFVSHAEKMDANCREIMRILQFDSLNKSFVRN
jgi:hypothetical protein